MIVKKLKFIKKVQFTKNYNDLNKYLASSDLIINTTPKNPINKKNKNLINSNSLISDIVYKPKLTKFLKSFEKNEKIYGISMLTEQAAICFQEWFGFHPKLDQTLIKKLNTKTK